MYLHLGQDTVIQMKELVGIFDLENTSISKITKEFLATSEKENQVFNVSYELPKSFVVCNTKRHESVQTQNKHKKSTTVYITQISAATLKKRTESIQII